MEFLIWLFVIAFFAGIAFMFFKIMSASGQAIIRQQECKDKYDAKFNSAMKHIEGLPVASGVMVEIYYCEDKIVFIGSNQEIVLSKERIINIETSLGSNLSGDIAKGAVAGKYLIGGLSGAAIGAIMNTTVYCIISYKKDDVTKFILFDTSMSGNFANKIAMDFNKGISTNNKIEL